MSSEARARANGECYSEQDCEAPFLYQLGGIVVFFVALFVFYFVCTRIGRFLKALLQKGKTFLSKRNL